MDSGNLGVLFRGYPLVGALIVSAIIGGITFLLVYPRAMTYERQSEGFYSIEFLYPYQAINEREDDGGANLMRWWIPVRLANGQPSVTHATIRVKWREAEKYKQSSEHDVWWMDSKEGVTNEKELIPGRIYMIHLVSRRAVNDERGWYGLLLERVLMADRHKPAAMRNEAIRFPAGDTQHLTVSVLVGKKELGRKEFLLHVPGPGKDNSRFWLQEPDTVNW